MKPIVLLAGPLFLAAAIAAAALVVHRRRASRRRMPPARIDVSVPTEPPPAARTGNATAGVEVLAGYDEQHEEDQEARHGAVLHIDVDRLSFGQI
jgi:hypothetical protein